MRSNTAESEEPTVDDGRAGNSGPRRGATRRRRQIMMSEVRDKDYIYRLICGATSMRELNCIWVLPWPIEDSFLSKAWRDKCSALGVAS